MPWIKGSITYGQLNLLTALSLVDIEESKSRNPSEEKDDPHFLQKLNEARQRALERQRELVEKKYDISNKDSVVSELTKNLEDSIAPSIPEKKA